MKARIAEKGFFMCRLIDGGAGWTELNDFVAGSTPSDASQRLVASPHSDPEM